MEKIPEPESEYIVHGSYLDLFSWIWNWIPNKKSEKLITDVKIRELLDKDLDEHRKKYTGKRYDDMSKEELLDCVVRISKENIKLINN